MRRLDHSRPSKILGIDDEYTAYCLDEACALIISKIDDDEKPKFDKKEKKKESKKVEKKKTRMLPSEIYKKYEQ